MITNGVGVVIADPVDATSFRSSVPAHNAGIPVVAYDRPADRPIAGYASFDGIQEGRLQGRALPAVWPLLLGLAACAALGVATGPLTDLLHTAAPAIGGH